jgi:hypothetical protein
MKCCKRGKKKTFVLCLVTPASSTSASARQMSSSLKIKKEKKNINVGNERTIKRKMEAENLNKVCPGLVLKIKHYFTYLPNLNRVRILDKVGQCIGVRTCTQRA